MEKETNNNRDTIKANQALNGDYCNTGYDRGHLNPNSYQCDEGREATFTLTNSAPMDACVNRVNWYQWEKTVKQFLKDKAKTGTAYLVTGTVPSADYRIPRQDEYDSANAREFNRVTVPTHIWTAVCYKHHVDQERSFSFGYIGLNQPDSWISVKTVPQLNEQLTRLYGASQVEIFKDDCFSTNEESEKIVKDLYTKVQLPISDRLDMSGDILNTFHAAMSRFNDEDQPPSKKPKVTGVKISETFDSLETWFKETERMKYVSGSTCVLSQQFTGPIMSRTGVQKRDITGDSQELVCSLVPEKVSGCTTSCLYKEEARGYYCYDGSTEIVCSPEYSIVTVNGNNCNSDHTCGTHGEKDYWCRVGSSREYCSPPLPLGKGVGEHYCRSNHNCGWYGYGYTWCYTDYNDNWEKCCGIGDDRFSALNGKTCKPDHPCGYYSYGYLWCYTTDGSWEYCCTQ